MIYDMYMIYIYIHRIYIRTIDYILRCVNLSWFPSLLDIVNPMAPCVAQARGLFAKLFPHLTSMKFIGFIQLWYFKMFSRFDTTIQFLFLARWVSGDLWTSFNLAPWDDLVLSSSCMSLWFAVNLIIMSQDPIPKVVQYRNLAKMTWHFRLLKQHTRIIIYIYIRSV